MQGGLLPHGGGQVRSGRVHVRVVLVRGKVAEAVKRSTIRLDKS